MRESEPARVSQGTASLSPPLGPSSTEGCWTHPEIETCVAPRLSHLLRSAAPSPTACAAGAGTTATGPSDCRSHPRGCHLLSPIWTLQAPKCSGPQSQGSCWHSGHTGPWEPQSHSHGISVLTLASPVAGSPVTLQTPVAGTQTSPAPQCTLSREPFPRKESQ